VQKPANIVCRVDAFAAVLGLIRHSDRKV
jgi:hypothetical protein